MPTLPEKEVGFVSGSGDDRGLAAMIDCFEGFIPGLDGVATDVEVAF